MRIEIGDAASLEHVARHMRKTDVAEFCAINPVDTADELADLMLVRYAGRHDTYAALGDQPIAFGAMVEARPNVATLLFFATDEFPRIVLPITRFIRNNLFPTYRQHGVHRIECVAIDGYSDSHRWIELLGLKREALLRGYGKHGETFHQFSWVADHVDSLYVEM